MIVVGGTYQEVCLEPYWDNVYGSGLRACEAILTLNPEVEINFHTFCDEGTVKRLESTRGVFSRFNYSFAPIPKTVRFYYDHPLREPLIFPRLDIINSDQNQLCVDGNDILYYGFIEGSAIVNGQRIVYDPQSPSNPKLFSQTGSKADQLVYVINMGEARILSGVSNIEDIIAFFFHKENAHLLVLKMGAQGALVADRLGSREVIPVYKTSQVWNIGSGDVFAGIFAHYWFLSNDAVESARKASWYTAFYCNSKTFSDKPVNSDPQITPLIIQKRPRGTIYLAGPFFTYAERWLVDQVRNAFLSFGLKVFSPWHDVGYGIASEVVKKDLNALDGAAIVFAVLDGLDSGTLFEIGYAIKSEIPVVGYVENESSESVKMLEGTDCILERDLTTAVYKCFWKMAENE
ncbi:MAG: nucleoside 2-deoxyribosyltransferase [Proteobacteria bacterium]|nr:MAG: nucleoside 2-deoxyribosyltransferase [Pseudomonadota bacterium]